MEPTDRRGQQRRDRRHFHRQREALDAAQAVGNDQAGWPLAVVVPVSEVQNATVAVVGVSAVTVGLARL